jgi:hypothetical protein
MPVAHTRRSRLSSQVDSYLSRGIIARVGSSAEAVAFGGIVLLPRAQGLHPAQIGRFSQKMRRSQIARQSHCSRSPEARGQIRQPVVSLQEEAPSLVIWMASGPNHSAVLGSMRQFPAIGA